MKSTPIETIPDFSTKARLEFTCEQMEPEKWLVRYELVLPLCEFDCRGTFDNKPGKFSLKNFRQRYLSKDNCFRMPLGACEVGTTSDNYPFYQDGKINLPFRDGAHCQWDNEKLGGLAVYYNTPKGIYLLEKEPIAAAVAS